MMFVFSTPVLLQPARFDDETFVRGPVVVPAHQPLKRLVEIIQAHKSICQDQDISTFSPIDHLQFQFESKRRADAPECCITPFKAVEHALEASLSLGDRVLVKKPETYRRFVPPSGRNVLSSRRSNSACFRLSSLGMTGFEGTFGISCGWGWAETYRLYVRVTR